MIDNLQKTPVKFGERIALDELVHGEVFDAMSQEAGLASDSAGEEGFSTTCPAVYQDVLCPVYEAAIGQLEEHLLCEGTFTEYPYFWLIKILR